jgi:molybdopterin-binding protein
MKLSARNVLKGTIKSVKEGPVSSLVVIEIAPGVEVVSSITSEGADSIKLAVGQTAYAVIKASSVLVGVE